ncbi:Holliday junction resolvase RuvX [Mycoplasmopsis synoviae]|uniref:Holliday junction resolvase RuvX n=1 Tax=Mycoplasmopsis synoviae TaxID=2109 RepID=UPI001C59767D|nr:Holliday junction resolvase RuvX [Mycoplasmopsis synoviae]QXV99197.1 Holliday junction resolvase RuvX [Mycoplasmopsis synoviae]UBM43372.1 Holliday junction resolvase RuvX [Mycoplasmopsis synoviae]UZW63488.1 Holliday junction resolvase RuvX [Mycoplasmopsis synoviae]
MRKLGIDFGLSRIGFAISNESNSFSLALENFDYDGSYEKIIQKIQLFLDEYKIDKFIIGYPLNSRGEKTKTCLLIDEFIIHLEENFDQKIKLINESYSSRKASEILHQANIKNKKQKDKKDMLAAKIILQDYLDLYK